MRKTIIGVILSAAVLVFSPQIFAHAATTTDAQATTTGLKTPQSVNEVINVLKNVKIGTGSPATTTASTDVPSSVKTGWNDLNSWIRKYLGTSFQDIIKFIAHLIASIFTFMASIFAWIETHV